MRTLLALLAAVALWTQRARIRCAIRGHHAPVRNLLGGFRCSACGKAGADLEAMGFGEGSGYVPPLRRIFSRGAHGGLERVSSFAEPERAARVEPRHSPFLRRRRA